MFAFTMIYHNIIEYRHFTVTSTSLYPKNLALLLGAERLSDSQAMGHVGGSKLITDLAGKAWKNYPLSNWRCEKQKHELRMSTVHAKNLKISQGVDKTSKFSINFVDVGPFRFY